MSGKDDWIEIPPKNGHDDWVEVGNATPPSPDDHIVKPVITQTESAIRGGLQGATAGFSDEGEGLGDAIAKKLAGGGAVPNRTATGDIPGRLGDSPTPSFGDIYRDSRDHAREVNDAAEKQNPLTYTGANFLGAGATIALPGGLIAQGALQGLGDSKADLTQGDVGGALHDTAVGGTTAALTGAAFNTLGKIGSKIADSNLGKTFSRGEAVQKYINPNTQTDLANEVKTAIEDRVNQARANHAEVRKGFIDRYGDTSIDPSQIAKDSEASISRYGEDAVGANREFGPMSSKEKADVQEYINELSQPKSAQELYKLWDDIGTKAQYYENTLKSSNTEVNSQLQALRRGIKDKLHSIEGPEGALATADSEISRLNDQSKLLSPATSNSTDESFLSTLGGKNKGNRREAVNEVLADNPELLQKIDDFQTFKSFNGQGGTGSGHGLRNIVGSGAGAAVGHAIAGPIGGIVGATAGAAVSHPPNQRAMVAGAGDLASKIMDKLPSLPPEYQKVLSDAMQRGANSLAVAYFTMSHNDPKFQAAMKDQDK